MNSRKHIYYITVSDIQEVAKETIGRALDEGELDRITEKILERINWYEPVEETILDETAQ